MDVESVDWTERLRELGGLRLVILLPPAAVLVLLARAAGARLVSTYFFTFNLRMLLNLGVAAGGKLSHG